MSSFILTAKFLAPYRHADIGLCFTKSVGISPEKGWIGALRQIRLILRRKLLLTFGAHSDGLKK